MLLREAERTQATAKRVENLFIFKGVPMSKLSLIELQVVNAEHPLPPSL